MSRYEGHLKMREAVLEFLCCPLLRGELEIYKIFKTREQDVILGLLVRSVCEYFYKIEDGIPDLLPPEFIKESDKRWMVAYDKSARGYYILMHGIIPILSFWIVPLARSG